MKFDVSMAILIRMKKRGSIVLALAGCLCLFALDGHTQAAESLDSLGGNSAATYQPPTDNPQNVPTSNLQTTSTGLQPVPGQATLNQQNLNGLGNLQVVGTKGGQINPNTTTIPAAKEGKNWLRPTLVLAGIAAIAAVGYALLRTPKRKNTTLTASAEVTNNLSQLPSNPSPQKAKKYPKKKTAKKRKAKK